ncbi:MAG: peptide deformylase [Chitinophagaceae bacterium]|nr:peptide deformylase [Oligoflexus sp.]
MTVLKVVEWPAKVLEIKSSDVTEFNEEFKQYVRDMHETMDEAGGIGLASNQVGVAKRVLTIMIPWEERRGEAPEARQDWHDKRWTFVNPVIDKKAGKFKGQEGCLSFPEIFENVERSAEIWVTAQDENGKTFEVHANGLFSVCLQHEIDHIDGVVFISRMSALKSNLVKKKILKRHRLEAEELANEK